MRTQKWILADLAKVEPLAVEQNPIHNIMTPDFYSNILQSDPRWMDVRKSLTMTASEFGMALGISKNGSRKQLYARKFHPESVKQNDYRDRMMDNGKLGEIACMEILKRRFTPHLAQPDPAHPVPNPGLFNPFTIRDTGLWLITRQVEMWSASKNTYGASPDGLIMMGDKIVATLEIKTPYKECIYQGLLTEAITMELDHYVQVQSQMMAVGVDKSYYACYTPSLIVILEVQANKRFQDWLISKLETFSNLYLNRSVAPPNFKSGKKEEIISEVTDFMLATNIKLFQKISISTSHGGIISP